MESFPEEAVIYDEVNFVNGKLNHIKESVLWQFYTFARNIFHVGRTKSHVSVLNRISSENCKALINQLVKNENNNLHGACQWAIM